LGDFGLKTGKRAKFVHFGHVFSENERFSAIFGRFLKKSAITLKEPYSQPQINTDGHGLGIEQVGRSRRDRRDRTAEQPVSRQGLSSRRHEREDRKGALERSNPLGGLGALCEIRFWGSYSQTASYGPATRAGVVSRIGRIQTNPIGDRIRKIPFRTTIHPLLVVHARFSFQHIAHIQVEMLIFIGKPNENPHGHQKHQKTQRLHRTGC